MNKSTKLFFITTFIIILSCLTYAVYTSFDRIDVEIYKPTQGEWQTSSSVDFNVSATIYGSWNFSTVQCEMFADWANGTYVVSNASFADGPNGTAQLNLTVLGVSDSDELGWKYYVNCSNSTAKSSRGNVSLTGLSGLSAVSKLLVDANAPSSVAVWYSIGSKANTTSTTLEVNVTAEDKNLRKCELMIDGVTNLTYEWPSNGTMFSFKRVSYFGEGGHTANVTCYDRAVNLKSNGTGFNWTVDTTSPVLNVIEPSSNGTWLTSGAPVNITINITELYPLNCSLYFTNVTDDSDLGLILNSSALTVTNKSQFNFTLPNVLGTGIEGGRNNTYRWYASCYDYTGNSGSTSVQTFYVDTVNPVNTTLSHPTNGSTNPSREPILTWGVNLDLNFQNYEVKVFNTSLTQVASRNITDNGTVTWSVDLSENLSITSNGQFYWNVTIWDKANNKNGSDMATKTFTIDGSQECFYLKTGWNYCGVMRSTDTNLSKIMEELPSEVTQIAYYNESKSTITFTRGSTANGQFNVSNAAPLLIYTSSDTTWNNVTRDTPSGLLTGNYIYYNITNATTGESIWNAFVMQNKSGMTFQQIEDDLKTHTGANGTNIMSIVKKNSTGSYPYFIDFGEPLNLTFVDFGELYYIAPVTANVSQCWNYSGGYNSTYWAT